MGCGATGDDTGIVRSQFAEDEDFRELLEEFVAALDGRGASLRAGLAARDLAQVALQAHQLKGAGGGYGFSGVTLRAAALERACKAGDHDEACRTLDALLEYLARVSV